MCDNFTKANSVLCGVGESVTQNYNGYNYGVGNSYWIGPHQRQIHSRRICNRYYIYIYGRLAILH